MTNHHTVLICVTNITTLKQSSRDETGFNAIEAGYIWMALKSLQKEHAEFAIHFVSPKGGEARMSPRSREEGEKCQQLREFFSCDEVKRELLQTRRPNEIDMSKVFMIICIGGHGCLVDFPECEQLNKAAQLVWYKNNGIIASISQGAAALINLKAENGKPFVENKEITCSTNEEEKEINENIPYYIEDKLESLGAKVKYREPFKSNVLVTDERLITAQNPQSSKGFANAVVEVVKRMANLL